MTILLEPVGALVDRGLAAIQTGPFGTQLKASDYVEHGIPVINVRNVGYGWLRPEKLEFVSDATAERLGVHVLAENDIVFGRKGAVDRHLLVRADQAGWMQGSDCIRLRFTGAALNPRYVSYAFLRSYHKEWMLLQCGNKATMASLNQDVIRRIELPLPSREQQDAIVSTLSAYDDLIENNRKRIALLEEAARLLYREWFVHLRFPGHAHLRIADGVPEGWQRRSLAEVATGVDYGFTASADHEVQGPRFLRITDIVAGRIAWSSVPKCAISEADQERFLLGPTDIVVARTGATTGWARRVGLLNGPAVFASYLVRFRFKGQFLPELAATYMESDDYKAFVKANLGGAAQPNASAKVLGRAPVLVPTTHLQAQFADFARSLFQQADLLVAQNQKLAEGRDLLLPRLMNGEIAV